jgi:hypothetical protein
MADSFARAPELDSPLVAGLSARFRWLSVEPQPGQYHWEALDAARDRVAASKKRLMLRVTAGMNSPAWVYERSCRKITFTPEDTNFLKAGTQPAMPVPWMTLISLPGSNSCRRSGGTSATGRAFTASR